MCPAGPVPSAESGSPSGQPSHGQGLGDWQIRLLAALTAQTQAMLALTKRIDRLIDAMGESDGMDDMPTTYMDGTPIR